MQSKKVPTYDLGKENEFFSPSLSLIDVAVELRMQKSVGIIKAKALSINCFLGSVRTRKRLFKNIQSCKK